MIFQPRSAPSLRPTLGLLPYAPCPLPTALCFALPAALLLLACDGDGQGGPGGGSANGGSDAGTGGQEGGGGADGGDNEPVPPAPALCDAPDLVDVSTAVTVGDGTPASCTGAELQAAAETGGNIVFDCGSDAVTIELDSAVVVTEETVIDGGGLVTLSGQGTSRILYLDSGYDTPSPRLTVQQLRFIAGQAPAGGEDTAQGGGAIYRDGGSLTVLDCEFDDNHAPSPGQDIAGGAIYAFGGGDTIIAGSSFTNNSASNGGAVGSLNGDLTLINTVFSGNAALGTEGNPGNGGCGGAVYQDGRDEATSMCGVRIVDNEAGAIGGGVFRVSNTDDGTWAMERSTVDNNRVTPEDSGNAGGLYLQGLALEMSASTVSRNEAFYGGGVWFNESQVEVVNTTISGNSTKGSNGAGIWLGNTVSGRLLNCTIADNHCGGDNSVAGGIFGQGLTLKNTIVLDNSARYTKTCTEEQTDGGGNLQWPDDSLCTAAPLTQDPVLSSLGDGGGDTEVMVPDRASPAVGLGTDCPLEDQLGNARAEPCTAGAVEAE